jgi:hypothetical protein
MPRIPGNRDQTRLERVLVLPVAAAGADEDPPVLFNQADGITNLGHLGITSR